MSFSRTEVQSFIDGFIKAGGDPDTLKVAVPDWLDKHPLYPQAKAIQDVIVADLESYRGVVVKAVVPVDQPVAEPLVH